MFSQNLHTHTVWDDGRDTAEEMILAARAAGLSSVGISLHAPMSYEAEWDAEEKDFPAIFEEMARLKQKYEKEIRVYLGIEWDPVSKVDPAPFDYAIGSIHHLPIPGLPTVDESAARTESFLSECFKGDSDAAAKLYFEQYALVAKEPKAAIVGHFDLLTKFDEQRHFFNPESPAYQKAAREAMEALVAADKIFEINTGAISRGYRTSPYPSRELLCQLRAMGGRVTISADAHMKEGIACAFDQAQQLARACGFTQAWVLDGKEFVPVVI